MTEVMTSVACDTDSLVRLNNNTEPELDCDQVNTVTL